MGNKKPNRNGQVRKDFSNEAGRRLFRESTREPLHSLKPPHKPSSGSGTKKDK